jgi:hypothetical protein
LGLVARPRIPTGVQQSITPLGTSSSQTQSFGGLASPTREEEELLPGLLPDVVLADSTLVFHPDTRLQALYVDAADTRGGEANCSPSMRP